MVPTPLLSLPRDILILLPEYLHNIEDYTNLSSTCRTLRETMATARPSTILRLAAAQTKIFFRPSPHFLVAATARELGHWARKSPANEAELATKMETGIDALLSLALEHCGLTMERIRELHLMRFATINPTIDVVDKCVGAQWYSTPNFWNGGVDDAYTISSDPPDTLFHWAIYGELFGPDFDAALAQDTSARKLSVETRLEYIKYCVPDFAMTCGQSDDPRRAVKKTGPYADGQRGPRNTNNLALTWLINSTRFRPHLKAVREMAGLEFQDNFDDGWHYEPESTNDWRQRMWEAAMVCQGLAGLEMLRPELRAGWVQRVKEWRERIERLGMEPETVEVGKQATAEYPFLLGDLRICASGYVCGT